MGLRERRGGAVNIEKAGTGISQQAQVVGPKPRPVASVIPFAGRAAGV